MFVNYNIHKQKMRFKESENYLQSFVYSFYFIYFIRNMVLKEIMNLNKCKNTIALQTVYNYAEKQDLQYIIHKISSGR